MAKGDFRRALASLREHRIDAVELSALRIQEFAPLVSALPHLELRDFQFVSIHAPSRFEPEREEWIVECLAPFVERGYPVVAHPDILFTPVFWNRLGSQLLIENMDQRKPVGRTANELAPMFEKLPAARFCFDIGHARQIDESMTEARLLLQTLGERLAEVHMSEVDTATSRHHPISPDAISAFRSVAEWIPAGVPVILETPVSNGQGEIETEVRRARESLNVT